MILLFIYLWGRWGKNIYLWGKTLGTQDLDLMIPTGPFQLGYPMILSMFQATLCSVHLSVFTAPGHTPRADFAVCLPRLRHDWQFCHRGVFKSPPVTPTRAGRLPSGVGSRGELQTQRFPLVAQHYQRALNFQEKPLLVMVRRGHLD